MLWITRKRSNQETAKSCLIDTLGCGLLALSFPACTKLLGLVVEGTEVPYGVRVPGTSHLLDPVKGAFDIGCIIRWLDFNDTWLAAEWDIHQIIWCNTFCADYVFKRILKPVKS